MLDWLKKITKYADFALAFGIMSILIVLLLPVPTVILDVLLAFSISIAVIILMNTLFIEKPLDLSVFPTLLLVTTLLRLSLNIASTRLILSEGHNGSDSAGHIIEAFGHFVMQGNVVIGIIVFMILTIINFIVITKGSGRIAEVAARFSLDAMPGKQMAIDADLSSGLITEDAAKKRRKELEDESTFYGAMDGANKFVRGDAIAGIIITFINLIGGMVIGVLQRGLNFDQAVDTYTILTIGEGLVSQIPALMTSLAAGLLVTKSGVAGSADKAIFGQLGKYPQALLMSSIITGMMSLVPGLPFFPFFMLSGILGGISYYINNLNKEKEDEKDIKTTGAAQAQQTSSRGTSTQDKEDTTVSQASSSLYMDMIKIELGFGLIGLVGSSPNAISSLPEQIKSLRSQLAKEYGFVIPPIRIKDNVQIPGNTYMLKIKEIEAARAEVVPNNLLVINPKSDEIDIQGTETKNPTFGLDAKWINQNLKQDAIIKGYTVIEPSTVIITHLNEVIKENITELLSYTETQKLLDNLKENYEKLVKDIVPEIANIPIIQKVLQNLLMESISIRDLPTILEAIGDVAGSNKNTIQITESVRAKLARQISYINSDSEGTISAVVLSSFWEQNFSKAIRIEGDNSYLAMQPSLIQQFISEVKNKYDEIAESDGIVPVLLTTSAVRPFVKMSIHKFKSNISVMSHNEICFKSNLKTMGSV